MAASITPAETIPAELKRQSQRVGEQYNNLVTILNTISDHLTRMSTMMEKYSPELVTQFKNLNASITDYQAKSKKIYGEVSESLATYANNLLHNLDNLTASVGKVTSAVKDL